MIDDEQHNSKTDTNIAEPQTNQTEIDPTDTTEPEKENQQTKELRTKPVINLLLKFAIPAFVGTFINTMYNVVDRVFLGHYVGETGIAATTVAMPLMMICMGISMLIGFGTNSQISIKLGEKNIDEAERLLGQGWFLFVVTSFILTVLSLIYIDPILRLFGASDAILPYARPYASIVMLGSITHEISFGANSFIRGEGNPKIAMLTMLIGGLSNLILDYLFIAQFGWGMSGAAWATVIGYTLSAIWVFRYYQSGQSVIKLRLKYFRIQPQLLGRVLMMGSPNCLMQLTASLQSSLLNNQLMKYGGDTAISIMGVLASFNFMIFMPIIAMSQGMQPVVGYNFGAKKYTRVKRALFASYAITTIICTLFFIFAQQWPELIFKAFISDPASELFKIGPKAARDAYIALPAFGYIILTIHYFQFTGRPLLSLSLTLLRQLGFLIPFIMILPGYIGLTGIWYGLSLSDICGMLLTITFYIIELSRLRILIKRQKEIEHIPSDEPTI